MSKVKVILNRQGVRSLLRSDEMKNLLEEKAYEALMRLGSGYNSTTYRGKNRVNVAVFAESNAAKQDNEKHNTLLKGIKG